MPANPLEAELTAAREDLALLIRRLRSLSPRARTDRADAVRAALAGLVALDHRLEGGPPQPPNVADHILADAIAVIGGDVLETIVVGRDRSVLTEVTGLLERALSQTR